MSYTYNEIVPYVLYQLNRYGCFCSKNTEAEIIGCSPTTVRKYQNTPITNPKLIEKLKNFPFPNNQIDTLYDDENDYIWIVGENGPYTKKKEIPPLVPLTDLTQYNLKLKYPNQIFAETSGLYMLAQVVCIPHRLNERIFLIKIGLSSTNLNKRIQSYKGMNPLAVYIDIKQIPASEVADAEKYWHNLMGKYYDRLVSSEWFAVPYEDYLRFLQNGFDISL